MAENTKIKCAWTRCRDALPEVCQPVLLARWNEDFKVWVVRDAKLLIAHEDVTPSVDDLKGPKMPTTWWFDSIYPGKGDMRLGTPDLLWAPMPEPEFEGP